MVEVVFRVAKGSGLYEQFFKAQAERQKFHSLAREFFERHQLMDGPCNYYMRPILSVEMNEAQKHRFAGQIRKCEDSNNVTFFKKNSAMQKAWTQEVVEKVDTELLDQQRFWYWPYIGSGEYALWSVGDEVYGLLKDRNQDEIKLDAWMIPIRMSEYYTAMEGLEATP